MLRERLYRVILGPNLGAPKEKEYYSAEISDIQRQINDLEHRPNLAENDYANLAELRMRRWGLLCARRDYKLRKRK